MTIKRDQIQDLAVPLPWQILPAVPAKANSQRRHTLKFEHAWNTCNETRNALLSLSPFAYRIDVLYQFSICQ